MIVLYAPAATVAALSGEARVRRAGAAAATTRARRGAGDGRERCARYLGRCPGSPASGTCRTVRAPGDWPGKADTEAFAQLLERDHACSALLSALVLISNTMTTLVAEQTREIGIMRAIGARRRQVALVYLRTACCSARSARLLGIALGIVLSNLLAGYFGSMFWAIDVGFGVDSTVVLVSVLVGLLGAAARGAAGDPARRRASTCARRSSRPAPRSAARTPPTGCCGGPASCRGRCRSGCATSDGASGAASRRR